MTICHVIDKGNFIICTSIPNCIPGSDKKEKLARALATSTSTGDGIATVASCRGS